MRIAFVTETWLPSTDGVVTRVASTVRQLRAAGHEVLIVAPGPAEAEFDGADVRCVPAAGLSWVYGGKRWGLPLPRVGRYLRDFQPDVVHVVNPVLMGIAAVAACRRAGFPLVASYHTNVARYAAYYHLGWLAPVVWWLLRRLHGRAAVNLATSTATCDELRAQGIGRVRLWPKGVDLDLFSPRPAGTREPGRPPVALYVGRLAAEKGLDLLGSLAVPDRGVRLVLVGDGPARSELTERFGVHTVTFTGLLHGAALADAYRSADAFVFPSTTETLGLVMIEALASGLPVIAVDSPASREILSGCAAARLFPAEYADRLPELVREVRDDNVTGTLSRLARREAEQWGWPAATESLLSCYREVIAAASPDIVDIAVDVTVDSAPD
ncbi:MAG TPA: glycosyltransferase family 1 protein [Pseudonocardiaceae bacterium]|nr:glycosyltransferase family 1 protein [Pseudonocardiaceae bacterium]